MVQEDSMEEGMATHPSILAWRNPMDRGAWWLQSMGLQIVLHDWETGYARKRTHTNTHTHTHTQDRFTFYEQCAGIKDGRKEN